MGGGLVDAGAKSLAANYTNPVDMAVVEALYDMPAHKHA